MGGPAERQRRPLPLHLRPRLSDPSRQAVPRGGKTFQHPPCWAAVQLVGSYMRITFPTTAIRLPSLISMFIFLKTLSNDIMEIWIRIRHLRTGTVFLLPQQNEAFFRVIGAGMASLKTTPFFDHFLLFFCHFSF